MSHNIHLAYTNTITITSSTLYSTIIHPRFTSLHLASTFSDRVNPPFPRYTRSFAAVFLHIQKRCTSVAQTLR